MIDQNSTDCICESTKCVLEIQNQNKSNSTNDDFKVLKRTCVDETYSKWPTSFLIEDGCFQYDSKIVCFCSSSNFCNSKNLSEIRGANDCSINSCPINGSVCFDTVESYKCICPPWDEKCSETMREKNDKACGGAGGCSNNLCLNLLCFNGGYSQYLNGYCRCVCPAGFAGSSCEIPEYNCCDDLICGNGGYCLPQFESCHCVCPLGFSGPTCANRESCCQSLNCLNGGFCKADINGQTCSCCCPTGRRLRSFKKL